MAQRDFALDEERVYRELGERLSRLAPAITRAAEFGTTGTLFGVVDALEHQEIRPFEQFVLNPILMAGLGAGIGLWAGRRINLTPETDTALKLPAVQEAVSQGRLFAETIVKVSKVDPGEAERILGKALLGDLDPGEFRLVRAAIKAEPEILKTDFGLAILEKQRPHLEPRVRPVDEPLRVTVERSNGKVETILPQTRGEAFRLMQEHAEGKLYIVEAVGRPKDLRAFGAIVPERSSDIIIHRDPTTNTPIRGILSTETQPVPLRTTVADVPEPIRAAAPPDVQRPRHRRRQRSLKQA